MAIKWIKSAHTGLRYYEHQTRKHGKQRDRYYSIRFRVDKKLYTYGVGWMSDGIPEAIRKKEPEIGFTDYCLKLLRQYKGNVKTGAGPKSPKESRTIAEEKEEAEAVEKEREKKENVTFGDFMTKTYLPQCKLDKKAKTYTIEEMLYRLHLADTIGDLPFSKIAPFHLERIKKDMTDKKKSDRTIQYVLQIIRQVFNTARNLGLYTGAPPTKGVRWPKLDNMKLRYLSISESETLLAALAVKSKNLHDMTLLSLHAGLRFGELAALTWSCVNGEAGTLAILNAKAGSRTAYLTERAKAMLKTRKQGRPDELIFPKRSGKEGIKAQASNVFADTVNDLKLNEGITDRKQKVTFHTLRHSFATHLYESTHDLYLTQRSLGHATGTMTARYAKMSESRLREGAAALEKAFTVNGKKESWQVVNGTK
ncbi:MAG: site-specific integrase [Deltaproteobacteria bacterium]